MVSKLTPACETLSSLFDLYQKENSRTNLDKVIAFIKRRMPAFTPSDQGLFDRIEATLIERHASPAYVKLISDLSAALRATPSDRSLLEEMPLELQRNDLLFWDYSVADLLNLSKANRHMCGLVKSRLVEKIDAASKKMTPNELLRSVVFSGSEVRHLDLERILQSRISLVELQKVLEKCPNLNTLVLSRISEASMKALTLFPLRRLTALAFLSRDPLSEPLLRDFHVLYPNIRVIQRQDLALNLLDQLMLMKQGKSFFEYFNLREKLRSLPEMKALTPAQERVLALAPDYFLSLSQEKRETFLSKADVLTCLSAKEMRDVAALPEETQKLLLEDFAARPNGVLTSPENRLNRLTLRNESDPQLLAKTVVRARSVELDPDPVMRALSLCGSEIYNLNLVRMCSMGILEYNQIKQILDYCPNLQKLVVLAGEGDVEQIVAHLSQSVARHSLTHIALQVKWLAKREHADTYLSREELQALPAAFDEKLLEAALKRSCPYLKKIFIFPDHGAPKPWNVWVGKGNDLFHYLELLEQFRDTVMPFGDSDKPPYSNLKEYLPWFFDLSPEKRAELISNKQRLTLFAKYINSFFRLSEEDQKLLLENMDKLQENKSPNETVTQLRDSKLL